MSLRANPSDKHNNGKAFELLSREVLTAVLSAQNKEDPARIRHNIRLTGVSGVRHQIDLECVLTRGENDHLFLVECKDQERPLAQEKVSAPIPRPEDER